VVQEDVSYLFGNHKRLCPNVDFQAESGAMACGRGRFPGLRRGEEAAQE